MIKVKLFHTGETMEVDLKEGTGVELLRKLNMAVSSTLIIVDGKIVPEDERIVGKEVVVLPVASGG